jgi:hypothetical protein
VIGFCDCCDNRLPADCAVEEIDKGSSEAWHHRGASLPRVEMALQAQMPVAGLPRTLLETTRTTIAQIRTLPRRTVATRLRFLEMRIWIILIRKVAPASVFRPNSTHPCSPWGLRITPQSNGSHPRLGATEKHWPYWDRTTLVLPRLPAPAHDRPL